MGSLGLGSRSVSVSAAKTPPSESAKKGVALNRWMLSCAIVGARSSAASRGSAYPGKRMASGAPRPEA
jgi:hypothetical protein